MTSSNPIVGEILSELDLTPDQIAVIKKTAGDLIHERAGGTGTAVLISPINVGIGSK